MKLKGRDIFQCPTVKGGITIENPEYQWIDAAHADNLSYAEFRRKPVWYQELVIAHYRTKQQMEAVDAFAKRPKKKPKAGRVARRR